MFKGDDGGPAFPGYLMETNSEGMTLPKFFPGMSLRDWFAGQALVGVSSMTHLFRGEVRYLEPAACAEMAYERADAMLAARKQEASNAD